MADCLTAPCYCKIQNSYFKEMFLKQPFCSGLNMLINQPKWPLSSDPKYLIVSYFESVWKVLADVALCLLLHRFRTSYLKLSNELPAIDFLMRDLNTYLFNMTHPQIHGESTCICMFWLATWCYWYSVQLLFVIIMVRINCLTTDVVIT